MLRYLQKYPLSLLVVLAIFYLSFFKPPRTDMDGIPNLDKLVHVCMYGGLCTVLWSEYLRAHRAIGWRRIVWGAIVAPVVMSGMIELLQEYGTDHRSGDWLDLLANSTGVGLAALLGYFVLRPFWWRRR